MCVLDWVQGIISIVEIWRKDSGGNAMRQEKRKVELIADSRYCARLRRVTYSFLCIRLLKCCIYIEQSLRII